MTTPRALTRNKSFLLFVAGQAVSQLGDRLVMVALPWLVFERSDSSLDTAVVLALYTLPYVLFGAAAGVVVDRLNKRTAMILSDLIRAGLVLLIPLAAQESTASVFVLAFAVSTATVLFDPSKLALLPEVSGPDNLMRANSILSSAENITEVLGFSIAGLVLAYVPVAAAFQIDAATFVASACALAFVRLPHPTPEGSLRRRRAFLNEMREGMGFLRGHAGLRANTLMVVAATAGVGASYPLTFFLAVRTFHGGARAFGLFEAVIALGYLGGSLAVGALAPRIRLGYALTSGVAAMGISLVLVAAAPSISTACAAFALLGFANALALITTDTYIQGATPVNLRGRIFGVRFMLTQGMYALSVLLGGVLVGEVDVRALFIVFGLVVVAPGIAGLFIREIREA